MLLLEHPLLSFLFPHFLLDGVRRALVVLPDSLEDYLARFTISSGVVTGPIVSTCTSAVCPVILRAFAYIILRGPRRYILIKFS
jgi:hypothetical protein